MILVVSLFLFIRSVLGYCDGKPNLIPFYTDEPTLVDQVTNGKKYTVGSTKYNSTFSIVHLWGKNEKDMGVVYGNLLNEELDSFFNKVIEPYLYQEFVQSLPADIQEWIKEKGGINKVLDDVYYATKDYTPKYFFEFMEGFSTSSGVSYDLIRRFNMIPQLIKALPPDSACTLIGANKDATTKKGLVQLRALDIGAQNTLIFIFPVVTVMHYDDGKSNPIVNILAAGSVGSLSGFSKNGLSISQKVWVTDESMKDITPGVVWNFQTYDIMRYSSDVEEMINRMKNSTRTMSMYLGLGDNSKSRNTNSDSFYMVKYRQQDLVVLDWKNQSTYECHPQFESIAYYDKSEQPSHNPCLGEVLLKKYHNGKIDAENIARHISPIHETGDAQSVIYDWQNDLVYISYGLNQKKAYNGQYVTLKMSELFKEQKPVEN